MANSPASEAITAGLVVIGDEILSGRTKDLNIGTVAQFCTDLGIALMEVRVIPDVSDEIVAAVDALRRRHTYVFTTGGIGPTHDDITAEAVARAFGVELPINAEALAVMEAHWDETATEITPARRRMARIPQGAVLIANPVSAAPGFHIGNVYVMAGVPVIMRAMLEAIAPTLRGRPRMHAVTIPAQVGEGAIGDAFAALQARFPDVRMGSYPRMGGGPVRTELVLRATDPERLQAAAQQARALVAEAHRKAGRPPDGDTP